ncbi:MAG: Rv1355c family protein [Flavobacteriales bacterium]|jgi:molybdopterin/thiamine biosynthesis adenylyltransferase/nitroreductase|nr:Rv1355c family protein [Flavobacteriales bacterium]
MFKDYLTPKDDVHLPQFFRLKNTKEKEELEKLLMNNKSIAVVDEIQSQIYELIKLRNPKKNLSHSAYQEQMKAYVGKNAIENVGVWIYYPWKNKVIHLLDEEEFVEVRTNRNHYKITPEEEQKLFKKKIGIVGLSVGKAIATTMALERICGEIVLADFDEIELSNLNRIQTSLINLGLKKTVVVAREIAEIDPYIKVTCLHEGITEENINHFFLDGNGLDLCIEVCDGLYEKVFVRQKAKEYGVPVVMNSSDRGTTDVERFDLEPDLPILHGLIDHLDLSVLKYAKTNEEKVPYLLPMIGVKTSTNRLKASMIEIQETITTWPQLASGVVLGGSICTDVCRRILLGDFQKSGRCFVDLEELINVGMDAPIEKRAFTVNRSKLQDSEIADYESMIARFELNFPNVKSSKYLTEKEVLTLVEASILAPSGGNIQPWKWIFKGGTLYLFNDIYRKESILNYKNQANFIAFGAATENLILASSTIQAGVKYELFPFSQSSNLIAAFTFFSENKPTADLQQYISKRTTNRRLFESHELKEDDLRLIKDSVLETEGAGIRFFKDESQKNEIKKILCELDRLFYTNKAGHAHFMNELRWTEEENLLHRDGLDIKTIDLTPKEEAGLIVAKSWDVVKNNEQWNLGGAFKKTMEKTITNAASLAMLTMPKTDENKFFEGGRALERLWLTATKLDIGIQPISINAFIFPRIEDQCYEGLSPIENELNKLSKQFFEVCALKNTEQNVFFFRLVSNSEPLKRSIRRGIGDVLIYVE